MNGGSPAPETTSAVARPVPALAHWLPTVVRWLPALAWMALLFLLSAQPGLRIHPDAEVDRPLRVVAHAASYAVLGALLVVALAGTQRPTLRTVLVAILVAVLFALSDEYHQSLVPDRTGRLDDVMVDAVGASVGALGAYAASRLLAQVRRQRSAAADPRRRG